METSVPPEVISSHLRTLSCSGLHVNLVYKLVICLECSEALDYRYLRGHVTQHGLTCPPEDELIAILQDLHLAGPPPLSAFHVIPPIVGLKLTDGFTCLAESCGINVGSRASLMRHREECHVGLAVSSEPCQVHRIYGFRGCQLVVRVDPSLAVVRSHGTLAEYLAVMRPKEQRSLLPLQPSDDPRKTTGFLHQSKWLQTVSGRSTQDVLSLVARPKNGDIFFPVVQAVKTNFKRMWDDVESMEVLPRRHIHTPKGFVAHHLDLFFFHLFSPISNLDSAELENRPFGRPQTEEYLSRCANHWAMYICALLRSLDSRPLVFALSQQQLEHCRLLSLALAENADLSEPVQSLSFSLISTYTSDVQRDNSLCPLSRFITFWHLREDGTFQPPSAITPNLASITYCFRAVAILEARTRMLADPSIIFME